MDFTQAIGLGVAGNFTGHLEQAGEAKDFVDIISDEEGAPKGIFPFYVPHAPNFLNVYPLSPSHIAMPVGSVLQPEPEVALICEIIYKDGKVSTIFPKQFAAYNDCSIRRDAPKISAKKNWGANSKGISSQLIPIDTFAPGGIMDSYRLTCYLKRNGKLHAYGQDSELKTYSYFYKKLVEWLISKMNTQLDTGPIEDISEYLRTAEYPKQAVISIGATRYTDFGEKTMLEKGDEVFVVAYDGSHYKQSKIVKLLMTNTAHLESISVLHQTVK